VGTVPLFSISGWSPGRRGLGEKVFYENSPDSELDGIPSYKCFNSSELYVPVNIELDISSTMNRAMK
jgi:hypothetical protein